MRESTTTRQWPQPAAFHHQITRVCPPKPISHRCDLLQSRPLDVYGGEMVSMRGVGNVTAGLRNDDHTETRYYNRRLAENYMLEDQNLAGITLS
jgi:hypothetical protein